MLTLTHRIAGAVALLTISTFMLATLWSEVMGTPAQVIAVKSAIPWGFFLLVPALMITGLSGNRLARGRTGGLIGTKMGRMKIIAGNGLLILMPSAFALAYLASSGTPLGMMFYGIQVLEIVVGALNIGLIALNIRDGLRLTAVHRRKARDLI